MKKLILFCILLFIGVFCSACVNSFAVYELNEKAMKLMEDGDTEGAAARWESSVDLDPNTYEPHYNLASVYIGAGKCQKALEHAKAAKEISKKEPLADYILAAAYECSGEELVTVKDKNGEKVDREYNTKAEEVKIKTQYLEYIENANKCYDAYVTQMQNAEDSDAVIKKMNELKEIIQSTKQEIERLQ